MLDRSAFKAHFHRDVDSEIEGMKFLDQEFKWTKN